MKYDDFIEAIENSKLDDWIFREEEGIYVFKKDIAISIVMNENSEDFWCDWVKVFCNARAYKQEFYLCYNGNKISKFSAAKVDSARMYIPCDFDEVSKSITKGQYNIGKIINMEQSEVDTEYDKYLKKANIKVIE